MSIVEALNKEGLFLDIGRKVNKMTKFVTLTMDDNFVNLCNQKTYPTKYLVRANRIF